MKAKTEKRARQYIRRRNRRRSQVRLLLVLSIVVVLTTLYFLMLPGITMERETLCGIQAHTHGDACFAQAYVCGQEERPASEDAFRVLSCTYEPHRHADECYDKQENLACGYTGEYYHVHSAGCFDESNELVCPLAYNKRHDHTDDCSLVKETLICEYDADQAHEHADACYDNACGLQETAGHVHDSLCISVQKKSICELEETQGHAHGDLCYQTGSEMVCKLAEGEGAHTHGDDCYSEESVYICDKTEGAHMHGDACFAAEKRLTCEKTEGEGAHQHDAVCYETREEIVCGRSEGEGAHHHDDRCYEMESVLSCGSDGDEHEHDSACYAEKSVLCCEQNESDGHAHTDSCIQTHENLTCGREEGQGHAHEKDCYAESTLQICGKEESSGHIHDEACCQANRILACNTEENAGHQHGESCAVQVQLLICEIAEAQAHQHTEDCMIMEEVISCGQAEGAHMHDETCRVLACSSEGAAHIHTETCWEIEEERNCGYPEEHVHASSCFDQEGYAICGMIQMDEHFHDDGCFEMVSVDQGHQHGEGCVEWIMVCQQEEHEHQEACYPADEAEEAQNDKAPVSEEPESRETYVTPDEAEEEPEEAEPAKQETATPDEATEIIQTLEGKEETSCAQDKEAEKPVQQDNKPEMIATADEATEEPVQQDNEPEIIATADEAIEESHAADDEPEITATPDEAAEQEIIVTPDEAEEPEVFCGKVEHVHDALCFDEAWICEEQEHTHTVDCLYRCGKTEHLHNAAGMMISMFALRMSADHEHMSGCYDEMGNLICALEEHIHDAGCLMLLSSTAQASASQMKNFYPFVAQNQQGVELKAEYDPSSNKFNASMSAGFVIMRDTILGDLASGIDTYYLALDGDFFLQESDLDRWVNGYITGETQVGFQFKVVQTENGEKQILIQFNKDYVQSAGSTLVGGIELSGSFDSSMVDGNGNVNIQVGDAFKEVELTYPKDETAHYDIDASKTGQYQLEGNRLIYTVTINSQKGTPDPIVLKDKLTHQNVGIKNLTIQSVKRSGTSITNYTFNENSANDEFTLSLSSLSAGQKYEITYVYELDALADNENFSLNNGISVEAKDPQTDETVSDSASSSVPINTQILTKSGDYHTIWNTGETYVDWTLSVNAVKKDIGGSLITDEMFAYIRSTSDVMVSPSNGYVLETDSDGQITGIRFTGNPNNQTYVIRYRTYSPESWEGGPIRNSAKYDPTPNQPQSGDEAGVTIGVGWTNGSGGAQKSLENAHVQGDVVILNWKATIVPPNRGGLPAGTVIKDTLSGDQWMTVSQFRALCSAIVGENWYQEMGSPAIYAIMASGQQKTVDQLSSDERIMGFVFTTARDYDPPIGTKHAVTYSTTGNLNGVTEDTQYSNQFSVRDRSASAAYEHLVPVRKMGLNGDSATITTDGNMQIGWKVRVSHNDDPEKVVITDTLPDGVELVEIRYGSSNQQTTAKPDGNGTISSASNNLKVSGSYSGNTVKLEVSLSNSGGTRPACFSKGDSLFVTYICEVKDYEIAEGQNSTTISLMNRVSVNTESGTYGDASHEMSVTIQRPKQTAENKLEKGYVWNNDQRYLYYAVDINPAAENLLSEEGMLDLKDVLHASIYSAPQQAALMQTTVKLYYAQTDDSGVPILNDKGRLIKGSEVAQGTWNWQYAYDYNYGNVTHTISARIPDSTAFVLEYAYYVTLELNGGQREGNMNIQNNVTLTGDESHSASSSSQEKWEVSSMSGNITSNMRYTFYKVDSSDYGIALEGAQFRLYRYSDSGRFEDAGIVYESDHNGMFVVAYQAVEGDYSFDFNRAYYVTEIKAPPGYSMPETPPKYYFYFGHDDTATYSEHYPGNFKNDASYSARNLSVGTNFVYCENKILPTPDLSVRKVWTKDGVESNPPTAGITVTLKRYVVTESEYAEFVTGKRSPIPGQVNLRLYLCQWNGFYPDPSNSYNGDPFHDATYLINKGSTVRITIEKNEGMNDFDLKINKNGEVVPRIAEQSSSNVKVFELTVDAATTAWTAINTSGQNVTVTVEQIEDGGIPYPVDTSFSRTLQLGSANDWYAEYKNLQRDDGEGNYYLYYVEENNPPANYTARITGGYDMDEAEYSYIITNDKPSSIPDVTMLTVQKEWKSADGSAMSADLTANYQAVIQLYQASVSAEGTVGQAAAYGDPVTLSAANGFVHVWEGLAQQDENGTTYSYYAVETSGNYGFSTSYMPYGGEASVNAQDSAVSANGMITITNTEQLGKLHVKKVWQNIPDGQKTERIDVTLIQYAIPVSVADAYLDEPDADGVRWLKADQSASALSAWKTQMQTASIPADGSVSVFERLPLTGYDSNGEQLIYTYGVEEETEGFTAAYSGRGTESAPVYIVNSAKTQLTITKRWLNADGRTLMTAPKAAAVCFALYRTGYDPGGQVVLGKELIDPTPYLLDPSKTVTIGDAVYMLIDGFTTGSAERSAALMNLPRETTDADAAITFRYVVEEIAYRDADGQIVTDLSGVEWAIDNGEESEANGSILAVNTEKQNARYELPETGGSGTHMYTAGGLMLALSAAALLINPRKRAGKRGTS